MRCRSRANKRLSHGMQFQAAFTWAKDLDNGQTYQDSYNVNGERGWRTSISPSASWLRTFMSCRSAAAVILARMLRRAVNWLLGGWQFNGITTLPDRHAHRDFGEQYHRHLHRDDPRQQQRQERKAGRAGGPAAERIFRQDRLQPAGCRSLSATCRRRVSDIRNDGIRNFDLSMFKEFNPVERVRVQFRAEFLNAFNTPRFGGPNTSVTSSSFGIITSQANSPRQTQFGLKFLW